MKLFAWALDRLDEHMFRCWDCVFAAHHLPLPSQENHVTHNTTSFLDYSIRVFPYQDGPGWIYEVYHHQGAREDLVVGGADGNYESACTMAMRMLKAHLGIEQDERPLDTFGEVEAIEEHKRIVREEEHRLHDDRRNELLAKLNQTFIGWRKQTFNYIFKREDGTDVIIDEAEVKAYDIQLQVEAAMGLIEARLKTKAPNPNTAIGDLGSQEYKQHGGEYPGRSDAANRAGDTFGRTECVEPRDQDLEDA